MLPARRESGPPARPAMSGGTMNHNATPASSALNTQNRVISFRPRLRGQAGAPRARGFGDRAPAPESNEEHDEADRDQQDRSEPQQRRRALHRRTIQHEIPIARDHEVDDLRFALSLSHAFA